jgi:hypothetical protein
MKLEAEKELEDYLFTKKEGDSFLFEPACEHYDFVFRQFSIQPYGIADLVYVGCDYHSEPRVHIVEIKKGPIDLNAITQIARYRQGMKHHLKMLFPNEKKRPAIAVTGSLVGLSLADNACYVIDSIDWLDCYSYKLSIDKPVEFKEECQQGSELYWHRSDAKPGFMLHLKKAFLKEYAASKRDFLKWQKTWESEQSSNVVEFKK